MVQVQVCIGMANKFLARSGVMSRNGMIIATFAELNIVHLGQNLPKVHLMNFVSFHTTRPFVSVFRQRAPFWLEVGLESGEHDISILNLGLNTNVQG